MTLDVSHFELHPIVASALDSVRFAAASRNIELVQDLDPDLGSMRGEATRIQQVLWNLLSNAVKFTPSNGRVVVRGRRRDTAVEFRIEDNGLGIAPEFLPHVFDRFQQEDASKTRKYGGLGLGLAIVRHIVELHGGWIWVESDGKDRGAAFTVIIPLQQADGEGHLGFEDAVVDASGSSNSGPLDRDRPRILNGLRVMVVDDQEDARDLVAKILARSGAHVTTLGSAKEALLKFSEGSCDLIICDIGMPDMDGYEFIRSWRRQEQEIGRRSIPAAALSAYAGDHDRQEALKAGFQSHLPKPLCVAELIRTSLELGGVGNSLN